MSNYFAVAEDGRIILSGACDDDQLQHQTVSGGVIIEGLADYKTQYWDGEKLVSKGQRPSPHHAFNYTTRQWEDPRTLADFKAQKWAEIKSKRFDAEYAGFEWDGSRFDSDAISQQRLSGAVLSAQMSPSFSIDWTLADDTVRTLNQADMIAVGVALGAHVQTGFSKGQALRERIESAATREEVAAVVW